MNPASQNGTAGMKPAVPHSENRKKRISLFFWRFLRFPVEFRRRNNLPFVIGIITLLLISLPVSAAPTFDTAPGPLQVTVTADPAYYTPGASCQITITVQDGDYPVPNADIVLMTPTAGAAISPSYAVADSTGRTTAVLSTSTSASGPVTLNVGASTPAIATVYTASKTGQASLVIPVQQSVSPGPLPPQPLPPQLQAGPPPLASISVDSYAGPVPLAITFSAAGSSDPDGAITRYSWDFGDGEGGEGVQVRHTYQVPGTYDATLTVYDNSGLSTGSVIRVSAGAPAGAGAPPLPVIRAVPASGSAPLTISFDSSGSYDPDGSITSYDWNFGDGETGSGPVITHTYQSAGNFIAVLIVTDNSGQSASADYSITVMGGSPAATTNPAPAFTGAPTPALTIYAIPGNSSGSPGFIESATTLADTIRTAAGQPGGPPPLGAVIPVAFLPLLAVLGGAAVAVFSASSLAGTMKTKLTDRLTVFFKNLATSEFFGLLSFTEIKKRGILPSLQSHRTFFYLSLREWVVAGGSALGFTFAFFLQNRLSLDITRFVIFLCTGAMVVILHDVGHKAMAGRIGKSAELQFWGLGTAALLTTAWLFGTAFAKPSRTIIGGSSPADPKTMALIQFAGPAVNLGAAVLSLALIPLGGIFAIAGSAGFSLNLLSYVYCSLPVVPMEGKTIYNWNPWIWAIASLPLLVVYIWLFLA